MCGKYQVIHFDKQSNIVMCPTVHLSLQFELMRNGEDIASDLVQYWDTSFYQLFACDFILQRSHSVNIGL